MVGSPGGIEYPEGFDRWPPQVQQEWLDGLDALYNPKLRWWEKPETDDEDSGPRPKQLPPDHPRHGEPDRRGYRCGCPHLIPNCPDCPPCPGNPEYSIWLNCTARGTGKTKAGSNWALEMALSKPGIHVGICAPKYEDVRAVLIEGESGILAEARRNGIDIGRDAYNKNRQEIELPNESKIRGFSAEKPDSIRGQNLSYCWFDELAMIRYFAFYHEGLMPALRKGDRPRMMITTTPKRVRLIRELLADAENEAATGVHLTEASSAENIHFSRTQRERLERKYKGTYLLEQEMRGKLVGDVDGALFPIEQFSETRVFPDGNLPQWRRVVVAIDPATTSREASDETGIVVMAEGDDGDYYCLEDCSGRFAPDQQMRVVAEAYYRNSADCVVGEVNMTGDYMRALLNTVEQGANIPLRTVHGMRGKVSRAQGPSSLFQQGRIHHVGDNFGQLEDQLSAMAEGDDRSKMHDDRADAWCLAEGTPVLTPDGDVPIERIAPGDLVWTRQGWKPVTAAQCTQRNAEVITVVLSNGRELTGTGDHQIWTENDGWKRLDSLVWDDRLSGWKNPLLKWSSRATSTTATRIVRAAVTGSTTSTTRQAESGICTVISGLLRIPARKSRKAGIFTTRTRTRSTTTRLILPFFRQVSIASFIPVTSPGKRRIFSITWTASARLPRNGMHLRRGMSGMSRTARMPGRSGSRSRAAPARSAVPSSSPCGTARGTARAAVSTGLLSDGFGSRLPARSAERSSRKAAKGVVGPAHPRVLRSIASGERRDVYDLAVADAHEFTASGVIVHNCWAILHLAGANQGDWGAVYGFTDCTGCGSRVNFDRDQRCASCGKEVIAPAPKHAGGRPSREPWSAAYLNTCPKCEKKYSPSHRSCPECSASPEEYLRRVTQMQQGGGGWHAYQGKDWLAGRRF